MKILLDTHRNTGSLHHAYLIEGDAGTVRDELFATLEKTLGLIREGNPDIHHYMLTNFGIDDSRKLKELHASRPVHESGKRIVVIETANMTREAQNALLKIMEEPQAGNHFFIIMPRSDGVLPTLRSRMQYIRHEGVSRHTALAKEFLTAKPKDRMDMVANIIKSLEDETMNRADCMAFLGEIIRELHAQGKMQHIPRIETLRSYIGDRSSSVKMILEYVAVLLES